MRRALLSLGLLVAAALALLVWGAALPAPQPDRPWAWIALFSLPGLLWAPGLGWAAWLDRGPGSGLRRGLDAAWIGLTINWIDVALARESGLRGTSEAWVQWALAGIWAGAGLFLARRSAPAAPTSRRERTGAALVVLAILGVIGWKSADLSRPLDGGWYLEGADAEGRDAVSLEAGQGWATGRLVGWPEAGALELIPNSNRPTLISPKGAHGRIALAVRGPLGSHLRVGAAEATVEASPVEQPDEGPVRRYLRAGVAGLLVDVDLAPGESLPLEVEGARVYVLPGTDAIWSLHATGVLRYIHYYQLLNQVENQDWAEQLLDSRWVTLNQPPGWSPALAVAALWILPDLQGANALFLAVLLLVGLSGVRLLCALAPGARGPALALPAAMAACHGLLMIEPGSTNFPDSLFAAALLGVATALADGRPGCFGAMGAWATMLRYPGGPLVLVMTGMWRLLQGRWPWAALGRYALAMGGLAVLGAGLLLGGQLQDAGFIVYFETFPEHWHGDYQAGSLLPRAPEFYALWLRYTGGAAGLAVLSLPFGGGAARRAALFLLGTLGVYSLILATVDHHPTHYFLPFVAMSGPMLGAAATATGRPALSMALPILGLIGALFFLWVGQV